MKIITTKTEFKNAAEEVFNLMNKGEGNLTAKERKRVQLLASAIQVYEKNIYPIEMPQTIEGMVELKMYEHKINQATLAKKLKLSTTKLSMILSGKQKPDIRFLKGVRKELDIDADFILDHI
ncbi:MAG TPA: helix-turn-helix domain-containing protein [Hanamia sp.]